MTTMRPSFENPFFEDLEPRLLLSNYPGSHLGDLNADGLVNVADLAHVQTAEQYISVKRHFGEVEPIVIDVLADAVAVYGSNGPDEIRVTTIGDGVTVAGIMVSLLCHNLH